MIFRFSMYWVSMVGDSIKSFPTGLCPYFIFRLSPGIEFRSGGPLSLFKFSLVMCVEFKRLKGMHFHDSRAQGHAVLILSCKSFLWRNSLSTVRRVQVDKCMFRSGRTSLRGSKEGRMRAQQGLLMRSLTGHGPA